MKLQNFSLALLVTATFGAGLFNDISAAAVSAVPSQSAHDDDGFGVGQVGIVDEGVVGTTSFGAAATTLDKRLGRAGVDSGAASKAAGDLFDSRTATAEQLRSVVAEKFEAEKTATAALLDAVSLASNMQSNLMAAKAELKMADANLKSSPAFLLTQNLTDADRTIYIELLAKGPQLARAIAKMTSTESANLGTLARMEASYNKASSQIDAEKSNYQSKSSELLALADTEYTHTENPVDSLNAEKEAKQAILDGLLAKQTELTAAISTLEAEVTKVRAANQKIVDLIKTGKGDPTKLVAGKKALAQKEASLKAKQGELALATAQIPGLQDSLASLTTQIADAMTNPPAVGEDNSAAMARLMKDMRSSAQKIAKMEKLLNSTGSLSMAKQRAQEDLAELQRQLASNQAALDSFEANIISRSAAAPAPLRRTESSPAIMAAAPALPPSGSAVVAPSELLAPLSPTAVSPSDGSAVPPAAVPAADAVVTGASGISAPPALKRAASEPALTRAQVAEQQHVERIGSGLTRPKGPTAAGNFNTPMQVKAQ